MLRALKKPLAGALAASLALCALPPAALADAVAFGARPAGVVPALHLSIAEQLGAVQSLMPGSLDRLKRLAAEDSAGASVERDAAQALLVSLASPDTARLAELRAARAGLLPLLGEENVGPIQALAERLHASSDAGVQEALARLQGELEGKDGQAPGIAEMRAKLDALFEGSKAEAAALEAAAAGDYTVTTFEKRVDGTLRRVVLLGEAHRKDAKSAELGRRVIDHFPVRGIEGFDPGKSVAGRLVSSVVIPLSLAAARLFTLGRRNQESSIDAAYDEVLIQARKQGLIAAIAGMQAEERAAFDAQLSGKPDDGIVKVDGHEVLTIGELRRALAGLDAGLAPDALAGPRLDIIDLEKGHKAGFAEKFASFGLLSMLFNSALVAALHVLPPFPGEQFAHNVTTAGSILSVYVATGLMLRRFEHRAWIRRIFGLAMGLVTGRNETMAANIAKSLEENQDLDKLLAIVGKAHVPGMKRLLTDAHGFVEIPAK